MGSQKPCPLYCPLQKWRFLAFSGDVKQTPHRQPMRSRGARSNRLTSSRRIPAPPPILYKEPRSQPALAGSILSDFTSISTQAKDVLQAPRASLSCFVRTDYTPKLRPFPPCRHLGLWQESPRPFLPCVPTPLFKNSAKKEKTIPQVLWAVTSRK